MIAYFESFGCKVNQYETEIIKSDLRLKGYEITAEPAAADVAVINSCTVTASGDSKCLYSLRRHRKLNTAAVIVLTGCKPPASPDIAENIEEADIVTGTKDRSRITSLVEDFIKNKNKIVSILEYGKNDGFENMSCGGFSVRTRAFVKIQDGCDQFCSYCIIPYASGRSRS